jgi:hypothetical protein
MAKKIKLPKVKSKKMHWSDKLFTGLAGLSTLIKHPNLRRSIQGTTPSGQRAAAAMLRKYGKWGVRGMGLVNPYTAVPYALTYGARHLVSNALEPYKNQDVENTSPWWTMGLMDNRGISAAGNERLLQERLAREERTRANAAARGEKAWFEDPEFKMWGSEGGIARLL